MAITNHKQFLTTQKKVVQLQRTLERMKSAEPPKAYELQAAGIIALIKQMQQEIDEYLGVVKEKKRSPELV
jgi:hypothetical protein